MLIASITMVLLIVNVTLDSEEMELIAPVSMQISLRSSVHFVRHTDITICCVIDIDECSEGRDDCHRKSNALCTDNIGNFSCTCVGGFQGNGTYCEGQKSFCSNVISITTGYCRCG